MSTDIPALLRIAAGISPLVALDANTHFIDENSIGINIDVHGCERLFKGEANIIRILKKKFQQHGFSSRICIAPSLGCAWAIARYGANPYLIISEHELREALAPLPVSALRINRSTQVALEELNLMRIEDVLTIPQKSLLARFGKDLMRRIYQAVGREQEILTPIPVRQSRRAAHHFNTPIKNRQDILHVTEKLLDALLQETLANGEKIAQLLFELLPEKGETKLLKNIVFSAPSSHKAHIWSLLKTHIEKINTQHDIISIALYSVKQETVRATHPATIEGDESQETSQKALGELLDTLSAQLGANATHFLCCKASHIPEESFRYQALLPEKRFSHPPQTKANLVHTSRPSLLFHTPRLIHAMAALPDSPPFWLKWRNEKYQLLCSLGPERIAPKWWGDDERLFLTRDYFKVQLPEGSWLWIFRQLETNQWFVHGLWA
jgi:protein ImuB